MPCSRDYLLFTGPLTSAAEVGAGSGHAQSPTLFWPQDRAWCVATEIDFDSTLVAGSNTLIDALLAEPALDAWRVRPTDALTVDADEWNRP